MSGPGETETRAVPVALIKAGAGVLLLLWLTVGAAFVLTDWSYDGPVDQRVAYGALLSASLVLVYLTVLAWRVAIGWRPEANARDARYLLLGAVVAIPLMVLLYVDIRHWSPWRIAVCAVLAAALIALTLANGRDRRRHAGEIAAPIAAMTVRTARGDREVRIGQPEGMHGRWVTRWSVGGTPEGTIQRVSYGPDPMRSLTAALADAEAATVVL